MSEPVREVLDQWDFVIAVYVIGIGATLAMAGWSWTQMRRAEAARDSVRKGAETKSEARRR